MGDSVVLKRVYKGCPIFLPNRVTSVDFIELDMLDFDVILGINWLRACFEFIDCRRRVVKFQFQNETIFEWNGGNSNPRGKIILCLQASKLIAKCCLYHIVRVKDLESKVPPLESVPIIKKFHDVFPDDLPRIPPELEIDFDIDLLRYTQPFSIPPYRMAPEELKVLKFNSRICYIRILFNQAYLLGVIQCCL